MRVERWRERARKLGAELSIHEQENGSWIVIVLLLPSDTRRPFSKLRRPSGHGQAVFRDDAIRTALADFVGAHAKWQVETAAENY